MTEHFKRPGKAGWGPAIRRKGATVLKKFSWGRLERGIEPPFGRNFRTTSIAEMMEIGDSVFTENYVAGEGMKSAIRRIWGAGAAQSKREGRGWRIWRVDNSVPVE